MGKGVYIDMRHVDAPDNPNCEAFEFSTIEFIKLAHKDGVAGGFIVAQAGGVLYAYHIKKFLENGLIDKTVEVLKTNTKKK